MNHNEDMPANEVDDYLAALDEPRRATLAQLRATILRVIPEADQGLSYGAPVFKIDGKAIAGFAAFKNHLSYIPHSGSVLGGLAAVVSGYTTSKGAMRFTIDTPLPAEVVEQLIAARRREVAES